MRKIRIISNKPIIRGNSSAQRSMAYVNAGAHYMRQVSGILKEKVNSLRHNTTVETPHGNSSEYLEYVYCVIKALIQPIREHAKYEGQTF